MDDAATAADHVLANMFAIETSKSEDSTSDAYASPSPTGATTPSPTLNTAGITDEDGLRVYHPPVAYTTPRYDNLIRSFLLTLTQSHPFLLPIMDVGFSYDKRTAFVCRPFVTHGSLRDKLWSAGDPTAPISVKYPALDSDNDHYSISPRPFKLAQIARYGKQILHALVYLDQVGLPFVNLHLGNVLYIADEDKVVLSEVESGLLGLYPRHMKRLMRAGPHDPVVVAFAMLLFEMATGRQMPIPRYPRFPALEALSGEYDQIADIIKFIFLPRAPLLSLRARSKLRKYQTPVSDASKVSTTKLVNEVFTEGLPPYVTCRDLLKLPYFADADAGTDKLRLPDLGEVAASQAERLKEDLELERVLGEDDRHATQYRRMAMARAASATENKEHKEKSRDKDKEELLAKAVALFMPTPAPSHQRPQSASAPYDTVHLAVDRRVKVMLWHTIQPLCASLPLAAHTLKDRLGVVKGLRYKRPAVSDVSAELEKLKASTGHAQWGQEMAARQARAGERSRGGFFGFLYSYDDDADEEAGIDGIDAADIDAEVEEVVSPYASALQKYTGTRQREPKEKRLEGLGERKTADEDEGEPAKGRAKAKSKKTNVMFGTDNQMASGARTPKSSAETNVVIQIEDEDDEDLF